MSDKWISSGHLYEKPVFRQLAEEIDRSEELDE
jgi:hypothetical protein